jgi:tetratricopeptide (TPR) repeat protein
MVNTNTREKKMNARLKNIFGILPLVVLLAACATTGSGKGGLTLHGAIEQSADKIAADLKAKSAVAVVAFESEHDSLSAHIMEELNGALFDRGMVVIEREHLEYVQKELNYQMSGDVSDDSAARIGRFFGAELVVDGRLTDLGGTYRYQVNAVHVETATRGSVARLDVANDRSMQRMVAALANQKTSVRVAKYAVTEQTKPQTATEYLSKGIMYAMQGEYGKAIAEFDEALKINPNLVGAYVLRARALYASVSEVIGMRVNFSGIDTVSTGGSVSAEQRRIFEQAIKDYTQALRLDPNNASIYRDRSIVYSNMGDYDRAIADHNQGIRLNPNYADAYNNRGILYTEMGEYENAIKDFDQAILLKPYYALAYTNRGNVYQIKRDYDHAIMDYNQAIQLEPNYAVAYYNRGLTYVQKGDYGKAIADCTQTIRLAPNSINAYLLRAIAYTATDDFDRAMADLEVVSRINPNDSVARQYIEIIRPK